jgi:3-oxoacyl-[acyl-carrier protein] reductase
MIDDLTGKTALVTGASRGIGRGIALALAGAGAAVGVSYRGEEDAAQKVCEEIHGLGGRSVAVQGDVAQASEVARLVAEVRHQLGPIGILVNNAGIGQTRSLDEITEKDWDAMLGINLKGAFLVTQAVVPDMRAAHWGRIIFLSSVAAQMGGVVGPHYAASKAGVLGLSHYYASRLAKEGITANAIAPGPIITDMLSGLPQLTPDNMPVGRFGTVEEVGEVALAIVRSGYITGQTININGGRYLG